MNSIERFEAWKDGKSFDRMPIRHQAEPEVNDLLYDYFHIPQGNYLQLLSRLGDDFRAIYPAFVGPTDFGHVDGHEQGVCNVAVFNAAMFAAFPGRERPLANMESISEIPPQYMPTTEWLDYTQVSELCEKNKEYIKIAGYCDFDFINGTNVLRGFEQGFIDIAMKEPVYLDLVELRYEFGLTSLKKTLEAGSGRIDIVHFGDDMGTQIDLLISPADFMLLYGEKYRKAFALAHSYGALTMMHVCGSVRKMIPYLIDMGLDILDVVQTNAVGMEITGLQRDFGHDIRFAGSMCVQNVLPYGTKEDVIRETKQRIEIFKSGGLIFGPSHLIQEKTPLENILAMYETVGSLQV